LAFLLSLPRGYTFPLISFFFLQPNFLFGKWSIFLPLKICYHRKMILTTIFIFIVFLFSVILHEISHAMVAYRLGDPTAKMAGRISLNPLVHLDFFGSFLLPLTLFFLTQGQGPIIGYAKPVPINPVFFKNYKTDTIKVALAGPMSNFILGVVFALFYRFFNFNVNFSYFLSLVSFYNFSLAFFNLLPFPPLDGSYIILNLLSDKFYSFKIFLLQYGIFLLLFFIYFYSFLIFDISQIAFRFFASFP
jgi:Zn-dependent protease